MKYKADKRAAQRSEPDPQSSVHALVVAHDQPRERVRGLPSADLTGIFMHGKILRRRFRLFRSSRALVAEDPRVCGDGYLPGAGPGARRVEIETVQKETIHLRKSYKMNSSCADILLFAAYKGNSSPPSWATPRTPSIRSRAISTGSTCSCDGATSTRTIERASAKFLDYTTDNMSIYPSPTGVMVGIDLAYNSRGIRELVPWCEATMQQAMAKIMKANPALYVLRERVRRVCSFTLPSPRSRISTRRITANSSATNYLVRGRHQRVPRIDHKTFEGNLIKTKPIGAIFIFNPRTGQLFKVIHTSVWAGQKRLGQWPSEDGRGSGGSGALAAGGGAAQADHRDAQGHARPARGAPPRLEHRHQGFGAADAVPGVPQD